MKRFIMLGSLICALLSCTKEQGVTGPAGPQGSPGPDGRSTATDTGTIAGKLTTYDEYSNPQHNNSGVTVTLSSGTLMVKSTTDSSGKYRFPGIKTGTYNFTYEKTGYGTMKVFGVSHFGGDSAATAVTDVTLIQLPVKTAPDTLILMYNNYQYTSFDLGLVTSSQLYPQYYMNMLIFISKNKTVGPTDYFVELASGFYADGTGAYSNILSKSDLAGHTPPINPGDTLYAVGYSYNRYLHAVSGSPTGVYFDPGPGSYYMDPQTGYFVYPNLSKPTNIIKFTF